MEREVIEVRIWNQTVGAVALDPTIGAYVFEYDRNWAKQGIELAPLMMPVTSRQKTFVFPNLAESFKRLPGLLSDALPDDFGNNLIDAWMAQKGVLKESVTALDRLSYMGRRGMGALEFRPGSSSFKPSSKPIEMKAMVEAARLALHGDFEGDLHAQAALSNMIRVGTSAGGARAKAVVAWNPQTQEIRSGQFDIPEGFEHWILKFDGVGEDRELGLTEDYGRIEYAYYLMAQAAGVTMAPCRLLVENDRAHFMTKRFDRTGNDKHHMQSLCGMLHLDYKQLATHAYEQLFAAVRQLDCPLDDYIQAFRRMAFNVFARNCDDHSKNFAFLLMRGQRWGLAPAYDVTHAHSPTSKWTAQHLMSVNGHFNQISRNDLSAVGRRFAVPAIEKELNQVRAAIDRWEEFASIAGLSEDKIGKIQKDFQPV